MLVRFSDRLGWQEQDGEILGQLKNGFGYHAFRDGGVGRDRQMRAVLLGGRDRQNGDRRLRVETDKVVGIKFAPEAFAHDLGLISAAKNGALRVPPWR